jgi:hypothetical protein
MTKADELEHKALQAAGIPVVWSDVNKCWWLDPSLRGDDQEARTKREELGLGSANRIWVSPWTDERDALLIATRLDMDIYIRYLSVEACWVDHDISKTYSIELGNSGFYYTEEKLTHVKQVIVKLAARLWDVYQKPMCDLLEEKVDQITLEENDEG